MSHFHLVRPIEKLISLINDSWVGPVASGTVEDVSRSCEKAEPIGTMEGVLEGSVIMASSLPPQETM